MDHFLPLLPKESVSTTTTSPALDKPEVGFGALRTERGSLPLVAMHVRASVTGLSAHTELRQTFRNALAEPIEATYVFPLPDRAAVTSFRLLVADRVIEGLLKDRGEARREYDAAIQQGHRAAIAEEERSGTFTIRVGNLPAQENATVELTLASELPFLDGEAEFRFPLVVAPRYVPGLPLDGPAHGLGTSPDTDKVPDASRVTPPVLLPGFPNPVQLSLEVEVDREGLAQGPAREWPLKSSLHAVTIEEGSRLVVRVQPGERLNRDFILRLRLAREQLQSTLRLLPDADQKQGTFALTVVAPEQSAAAPHIPREVVFLLDRSGSMGGWKMVAARRALGRMVDTLLPQDRFAVVAFDNACESPPVVEAGLAPGTQQVRWRTIEWLARIEARGGTELEKALLHALDQFSRETKQVERLLVLVTDGQVGGEDVILRALAARSPNQIPRIFTLGIDQAVNAGFLNRLADMSGGQAELVESEDRLDEVMDRMHRQLGTAVMTNVRLALEGAELVNDSLVPSRDVDLFSGCSQTIRGRYVGDVARLRARLTARDAAGRDVHQDLRPATVQNPAIHGLWGRARVRQLEDRYAARSESDLPNLAKQIVAVSLATHVLSRFTAYVAVDRSAVVHSTGQPREIMQAVEMPAGWESAGNPSHFRPMSLASMSMSRGAVMRDATCESLMDSDDEESPSLASQIRDKLSELVGGMRRRSMGDDRHSKLAGASHANKRHSALTSDPALVALVESIRQSLARVAQAAPSDRTDPLARLLGELVELAAHLRRSGRTEACGTLDPLVQRTGDLVEACRRGDLALVQPVPFQQFQADLESCLDVFMPSAPAAKKERFWA